MCISEGKEMRSRCSVRLPRHHVEEAPALADGADICETVRSTRRLQILVVDDNEDAAQMLAMYLENLGHHVLIEHTAQRALARANGGRT